MEFINASTWNTPRINPSNRSSKNMGTYNQKPFPALDQINRPGSGDPSFIPGPLQSDSSAFFKGQIQILRLLIALKRGNPSHMKGGIDPFDGLEIPVLLPQNGGISREHSRKALGIPTSRKRKAVAGFAPTFPPR